MLAIEHPLNRVSSNLTLEPVDKNRQPVSFLRNAPGDRSPV